MNANIRGNRLRTDPSPGVPVMFRFGVKPECETVIPVVTLATPFTRDATSRSTSVITRIVENDRPDVLPIDSAANWNT